MMTKRRRDSDNNGFEFQLIPKARRSARRICSQKKLEDQQVCKFDLLAAVAGKLLQENEHSSASSNETETKDHQFVVFDRAALKSEPHNLDTVSDTDFFHKKETQILDEHLFALSTSDISENVQTGLRIGISVRAEVLPNVCSDAKIAPKPRDHDFCDDEGVRHAYFSKKAYHERDGGFLDSSIKKRKFSGQGSTLTSGRGISNENCSQASEECPIKIKNSNMHFHEANEQCSSTKNQPASCHATDSQVRLNIISFKVPELLVEVPVTATVGSLKATVLDAVISALQGGFDVEVIVGGKRIRDDTETLTQSGISRDGNLDSLEFVLEPSSPQTSSAGYHKGPLILPTLDDQKHSERSPSSALPDSEISDGPSPFPCLSEQVQIDDDPVLPTATDASPEKSEESKALALFPVASADPLSIVPIVQKNKRTELTQRRTRRPFSAAEVEALVLAVEELGTGRWRDVKMRSFENADHRTYVDLKDKWKTLVHTAQISPQKRRGQPVPQELLNRVLAAHSYWSQHHQVKSHTKLQFRQATRSLG